MSRNLKKGPRGGVYYVSRNGSRVYVDRSSLPNRVARPRPLGVDAPANPNGFGLLDLAGVAVFLVVVVPIVSLIG